MTTRGGLWLALALLSAGCPGTKEKQALAVLAEGCNINSDCSAGLICAFRRCHEACKKTSDCILIKDTLCMPANPMPLKACLLPDELHCEFNSDCEEGLVCGVDGKCRAQCLSERDCVELQHCVQGTCADDVKLDDGGFTFATLIPPDGGVPGAQPCSLNSDCTAPLVCRLSSCLPQCKADRDCPAQQTCNNQICVQGAAVDAGEAGSPCVLNSDCTAPLICRTDGVCGPQCNEDRDCAFGETCTDHVCINPSSLDAGAKGWPCALNSDCAAPLICNALHVCSFQCVAAVDCDQAAGYCCYQNQCLRGPVCNHTTTDGGVIVTDGGPTCINDLDCDAGFCQGFSPCVGGFCQKPLHPICDDGNPCTNDLCDPNAHTCSYQSLADAGDDDHDNHYARACGGTADDCDDTNPYTYTGAPERCDFQDNNCDGFVDEFLWHERLNSEVAISAGGSYPPWAGVPQAVRVDGGILLVASSDTVSGSADVFFLDDAGVIVSGPLRTVRSITQWTTAASASSVYGKRALSPQIAVGDGHALVSSFVADIGGATDCPTVAPFTWAVTAQTASVTLDGTAFTRWTDLAVDTAIKVCSNPPEGTPAMTSGRIAFNPRSSRWLIAYGTPGGGSGSDLLYVNHYVLDGGLGSARSLLPVATDAQFYEYNGAIPPRLVVGASNVLVAWLPYNGYPSWVLMSDDLSASVSTVKVSNINQNEKVSGAGFVDGRYYVIADTVGYSRRVIWIDPTSAAIVGTDWLPPPSTYSTPGLGDQNTAEGAVAPVGPGMLYAVNQLPNIRVGWAPFGRDGGYGDTIATRSNVPRSGSSMVVLDEQTAIIFYADGDLKRTIIECAP